MTDANLAVTTDAAGEIRRLREAAHKLIHFEAFARLDIQEYVQAFKAAGIACFPLVPHTKKPLINWGEITPENCDYSLIQGSGYGVKLPEQVVVVDIDPRNGGFESFFKLFRTLNGKLEVSMAVKTQGGGYHFYFLNPQKLAYPKKLPNYPGIDILSEKPFVVGPGSEVEGRPYLLGRVLFCLPL